MYRDENDVLINKLELTDAEALKQAEGELAFARSLTLDAHVSGPFTFDRLCATHDHLFQDVYPWAGCPRKTALMKAETTAARSPLSRFTAPGAIEAEAKHLFAELERNDNLKNLSRGAFAVACADLYAGLNRIHAFREGNGRTNRAFVTALATAAGHTLNFEGVSSERNIAAAIAAMKGDMKPMREMFDEIVDPERGLALANAASFLRDCKFDIDALQLSFTAPGKTYEGRVVGIAGPHFMLRADPNIHVGYTRDLPRDTEGGGVVAFLASGSPNPHLDQASTFAPRPARRADPATER